MKDTELKQKLEELIVRYRVAEEDALREEIERIKQQIENFVRIDSNLRQQLEEEEVSEIKDYQKIEEALDKITFGLKQLINYDILEKQPDGLNPVTRKKRIEIYRDMLKELSNLQKEELLKLTRATRASIDRYFKGHPPIETKRAQEPEVLSSLKIRGPADAGICRSVSGLTPPFDFIKGETYANAIQLLRESYARGECPSHPLFTRDDGRKIARPLTFKETIEAKVSDYHSKAKSDETRLNLFNVWLDSCTGIAYKANSGQFKIIPVCKPLIEIPDGFNQAELEADYSRLQGIELDRANGKYDTLLTKPEVLQHPAWLAAVEQDSNLLRAYAEIIFAEKQRNLMSFWLRSTPDKDVLRALDVSSLGDYSNASGGSDLLNNCARFVRVAH